MNESNEFINIIDSRVNKIISDHKISFKYPAIVKDISNLSGKIGVQFPGDDKILYFFNKSNSSLSVGDSVYVEAIGGDLTNGVITLKYGKSEGGGGGGQSTTIQVGETITGEPGTNANVVNTGTPTDVVLSFTIPRGENGKSPYEVAVEGGYSGSEVEFNKALANVGGLVRPNLLDNAYFTSGWHLPINQKGKTSITFGPGSSYDYDTSSGVLIIPFIDRWKVECGTNTKCTVTLDDDGITIRVEQFGEFINLIQYGDIKKPLDGKIVTASMLVEFDGTATLDFILSDTGKYTEFTNSKGLICSTLTALNVKDRATRFYSQIRGVGTYRYRAAKLEIGDNQTLAYQDDKGNWDMLPQMDTDYGVQLRKCQRFLVVLTEPQRFIGICTIDSIYGGQGIIFTPVPMRTTPVLSGQLNLYGFGNNTQITPSVIGLGPTGVRINFTGENLANSPCMAFLYNINPDNPLILSAEL